MQRGGITLLVLVTMIVLAIIVAVSVQFISGQTSQLTNKKQEQQAFGLADAGVQYAIWLLAENGGHKKPADLEGVHRDIKGTDGQVMGFFDLSGVAVDSNGNITFTSTGKDIIKQNICQIVDVRLSINVEGDYKITGWNQRPGNKCP
ncbi:MAG: hypothetical protein U1C49_00480 [Candidatus Andersenbacteria bacterium]|nr:hypothetical protein [bacterium]MDZ4225301.1 hypothetical protein [Candidatus Andersenbacteria bacterium]